MRVGSMSEVHLAVSLTQLDKDASTQRVEMEEGDTLMGDTLRSTLAEVKGY